jgi:steroid delta-isomerase-like uncharacterized protein
MAKSVKKAVVKAVKENKSRTKPPVLAKRPTAAKKPTTAGRQRVTRTEPEKPAARKPPANSSGNGAAAPGSSFAARLATVRALLEAERRHDVPGILACFSAEPTVEFVGGPRHSGAERVGQIYADLLRAFPDLVIDVIAEHVGEQSVVVELVLRGTHRQQWLGMAPRGRTLNLPACSVFLFDKRDQLSGQRIYLDRNLAIVQLTSGLLR